MRSKLLFFSLILLRSVINRQRLADLETFHLRMREEIDLQKSELNEKNEEISKLKEELSLVRVERNENIFQVQSMLKDYDLYSKNVTSFNPPSSRLSLSIGGVNMPGKVRNCLIIFSIRLTVRAFPPSTQYPLQFPTRTSNSSLTKCKKRRPT